MRNEHAHVLIRSEGLQDMGGHERAERLADAVLEALGGRGAVNCVWEIDVVGGRVAMNDDQRVRSHLAARYGRTTGDAGPSNPVDLEQREGRVHRYKGHAVRKNVAAAHTVAAFASTDADPWEAAFEAARAEVASTDNGSENGGPDGLRPYWVYTGAGSAEPARIERYVPAMPLSKEIAHYDRLRRTVAAYRLVMGQPRQDDLVEYIATAGNGSSDSAEALDWMRIDLTPDQH